MKKKILACLLILFPILSLGLAKADTEKNKSMLSPVTHLLRHLFSRIRAINTLVSIWI